MHRKWLSKASLTLRSPPSTSASSVSSSSVSSSSSTSHSMSKALYLPEILELIFIHLSQSDLRFSASLVCRAWCAVSRSCLTHSIVYRLLVNTTNTVKKEQELRDLVERLDRVHVLDMVLPKEDLFSHYNTNSQLWKGHDGFMILIEAIDMLRVQDRMKLESISFRYFVAFDLYLQPLVSRLPMLTRLRLCEERAPYFAPYMLLRACPGLVDLYVWSGTYSRIRHESVDGGWDKASTSRRKAFNLESLVLSRMSIEEPGLEQVLEHCPRLQKLHLVDLWYPTRSQQPQDERAIWVSIRHQDFLERFATYCPKLNSFHYSYREGIDTPTASDILTFLSFFPQLKSWSMIGSDVSSPVLDVFLPETTPMITSLEITRDLIHQRNHPDILHMFLCQAPHLLHLSLSTFVPIECLDLEGNLTSSGWYRYRGDPESFHGDRRRSPRRQQEKKIWACRQLKTLELDLCVYLNLNGTRDVCRLIYSYLSKVCPNLEELLVRRQIVDMKLECGIILLSRLQKLRRLVLILGSKRLIPEQDVEWMRREWTERSVRMRQLMMIPGLMKLENVFLDQLAPFGTEPKRPLPQDAIAAEEAKKKKKKVLSYMIDGVDMRNLGRIYDIIDVIRDRADKKWICWPQMEDLQFVVEPERGNHDTLKDFGSLKPAVRKVRPEAQFIITERERR
ncbi:hypothetical protein BGZ94_003997 [Podila epigama]|nr:hypothetical protein BGZ94_003997 [Podila epigama]